MIPLLGYADRLSARPGETVELKISSAGPEPFEARLVRIVCADPNPAGPGPIEEPVDVDLGGPYPSRIQPFYPGSHAIVEPGVAIDRTAPFSLSATIWATTPNKGEQAILSCGDVALLIDDSGAIAAEIADMRVSAGAPLRERAWARVELRCDPAAGRLSASAEPIAGLWPPTPTASAAVPLADPGQTAPAPVVIAARLQDGRVVDHFNGKIEAPTIRNDPPGGDGAPVARWDFARGVSTTRIEDIGPNGHHGRIVNLPVRGMTGSTWDGSQTCWRHAPEQYGAIHFHDDDIYDFSWETDFSFTIPDDLPSGVYAVHVSYGGYDDAIPVFVPPPRGRRSADLCVLASTFTYVIYGNHARPDFTPEWKRRIRDWGGYPHNPAEHREYGLSTYNFHSDGSGICHASHHRPLFTMRPGYITFGYGESGLRHFQADSHLWAWLHAKGYEFDIVTDKELHEEGVEAIAGYKALATGSHPEYHTAETLDALTAYRDGGGRLIYLGGNGFYWKVALHPEEPGAIEIRRAEDGIRAWASEPGEYFNAFDGGYGGLWRRNGRPPQLLCGVGFTAQGQFEASYYRRKTGADAPPAAEWAFAGIEDETIGDFGFSAGGAAGFELDRADHRLGSPDNAQVLASSEKHGDTFVLVPEEILTHITNWPHEPVADLLRADMVYFEAPGGGEVFSTGSIAFCGSLPHNGFDNNVSRLLQNVIERFLRD